MYIGVGRFELFIPASTSLKDKRQVIRSVSQSVRGKFNVSISEVDHQQLWQRAAFGVACTAASMAHCRKVLQEVEKAIARGVAGAGEIVDRTVHVASMEDL